MSFGMRQKHATINISMIRKVYQNAVWKLSVLAGGVLYVLALSASSVSAITALPTPDPIPGSYGVEATKKQPAPTEGASISTPGNGASFSTSPITVNGICPKGLLVQVYDNGVMVGSVMCESGTFSIQISLFAGTNELSVIVYDDLGQAGPTSNTVTVTYTDTRFSAFGQLVTLTSSYGRRSAPAGSELTWPLQLAGGTGPYAFSIDWGDGSKPELKSQALTGLVSLSHTYAKAGIYQVNITVTDANGVSAFLQVVAVASGKVDGVATSSGSTNKTNSTVIILWIPAVVALILLFPAYWLGRRSEIVSIRNRMLKERENFDKN